MVGPPGPGFSSIITISLTKAGAVLSTRFTLLCSVFSLGGSGGGDSLGGRISFLKNASDNTLSLGLGESLRIDRTSTD